MSTYGNTAAHMNDNKIKRIVRLSDLLCITLCNSLLIKRMEY